MGNPYPVIWQDTDLGLTRLGGQLTFTDPSNQPGGGSGSVTSVSAGDASITIGGTPTINPTVAVTGLGITTGKLADLSVTQAKIAAKAVDATQMGSAGPVTANWVPLADGSGGVVWGASPGVNSVTAANTSVVVAGTGSAPTVRTNTLDVIATQEPPAASWSNNSHKITNLANGASAQDAAAFGQIPTALPPNGSAGGDLSGTYPNPTVAAIEGVAVSSTPPSANQVLTASDATHAAWATAASGASPLTTKGDVYTYSTTDARLAVGSNGQVLTAASGATTGNDWEYPPGYEYDYVEKTSNTTVTAGSAPTAQTWIDGNAVTYDGSTRVKIEAWVELAEYNVGQNELVLELYDGSTDIGFLADLEPGNNALGGSTLYGVRFLTPSNGSHTYHVKAWKTAGGTATLYAGAGGANVRMPAWYRVTKA